LPILLLTAYSIVNGTESTEETSPESRVAFNFFMSRVKIRLDSLKSNGTLGEVLLEAYNFRSLNITNLQKA